MKLLTLLLAGLSAVVLCHGTDYGEVVPTEFCPIKCENGICMVDHGVFKCSCVKHWFGDDCSEHICSRDATLCKNDGTCVVNPSNISDHLCACPLGYSGRSCQYLTHGSDCSSNPCGENGTCYNLAGGGYECICRNGSYGTNCNISSNYLCTQPTVNNCYGNGVCRIENREQGPAPICYCYGEYEPTVRCKYLLFYSICDHERPCVNGGLCHYVPGNSYSCECPTNVTGVNCTEEFNICKPNPCENGGQCVPTFSGHYYECRCPTNYDGYNCEYIASPCEVPGVCSEGETCVVNSLPEPNGFYNISTLQTECLTCEVDHCSSAPCGSHGTCTSTPHSYICDCHSGYTGVNCSLTDYCASNSCSSHSIGCVNLMEESTYLCRCVEGWGGGHCDQDVNECTLERDRCNGGTCVNHLGTYLCENCPPGKTGVNCESHMTCNDAVCQNGGTCSEDMGVATCNCPIGFTGVMCESEDIPAIEPSCTPTESCIQTAALASLVSSLATALVMLCSFTVVCGVYSIIKAHSNKTRHYSVANECEATDESLDDGIAMNTKSCDDCQATDVMKMKPVE